MPRIKSRKSRKSRKGRRKRGGGAGCSLEDSNKMIIQNGGGFMDTITGAFSSVGSAITTAGSNVKSAASNTVNNAKRKVEETKNMVGDRVNNTLAAAKGDSPAPDAPVDPVTEVPVEDSEFASEVSPEPVMVGPPEAFAELESEEEERRKSLANLQPSVGGRRKRRRKTKRKSRRKRRKTKRRSKKRRKRRRTRRIK
uniref:Uncharacterized protein n=1 Tax=viral metagenome TaxID=1070528 RepID=A0A6C0BYB0_9ZZZZ